MALKVIGTPLMWSNSMSVNLHVVLRLLPQEIPSGDPSSISHCGYDLYLQTRSFVFLYFLQTYLLSELFCIKIMGK